MFRTISGLLIAFAALFLTSSLRAASVMYLSYSELSKQASVIVHAEVTKSTADWNEAKTAIWTNYDLKVTEFVKGNFVDDAVAHGRGGKAEGKAQRVSGEPELAVGSTYLLFLQRNADGYYRFLGKSQGVFTVSEEKGIKWARNSYSGLRVVSREGKLITESVSPTHGQLPTLIKQAKVAAGLIKPPVTEDEAPDSSEDKTDEGSDE